MKKFYLSTIILLLGIMQVCAQNIPNGTYQVIVSDGHQSDSKTLMILH